MLAQYPTSRKALRCNAPARSNLSKRAQIVGYRICALVVARTCVIPERFGASFARQLGPGAVLKSNRSTSSPSSHSSDKESREVLPCSGLAEINEVGFRGWDQKLGVRSGNERARRNALRLNPEDELQRVRFCVSRHTQAGQRCIWQLSLINDARQRQLPVAVWR